ncbi:MAG: phytanoyl-CoA dioxygenase family protein [Rhodospirillales bacterium]|jgi:ectoine hydroxylase
MGALNSEQIQSFEKDGFYIVRNLFDNEEMAIIREAVETDPNIQSNFFDREDNEGLSTKLISWNHPGDSSYGLAARSKRIVESMEELLGGEVYHYHTKLTAKEPKEGGSWEWHQDYGYWYHNGIQFPYMANVIVPLDPATKENGCLEVLKGSHLMGRIDHDLTKGDQAWADQERMKWAEEEFETVHCEMEPGDGLFFHCNLLHRSAANRSENRRWYLIFCYNAARNNPRLEHNHPFYTPLQMVDDEAIKNTGVKLSDGKVEDFRTKRTNPPRLQQAS